MSDPIWQLGDWQQGYDEGRRGGVKTALDERDTLRKQLDEARELLVAAQELLCLVWEYEGDVFGVEHNNATDVNIGITAWLKANK